MKTRKIRISEAEWEIMKILWNGNSENGYPLGDIVKELSATKKWSYTTIRTLIVRLIGKGVVNANTNTGVYRYTAAIPKEECVQDEMHSFISRIFDDSPSQFVATLINDKGITEEEKDEILKIIKEKLS